MKKVLITGATGLLGSRLTEMLLERGYSVNQLSRNVKTGIEKGGVQTYWWDIENGEMDKEALVDVSTVIHLAGAGVADKRWSKERKKEILDSRIKSARLLYDILKKVNHSVKTFISASAVGYYGDCGNEVVTEEHEPGKGFLADVCRQWEDAAMQMGSLGLREVRCRIGIVLAKDGGALPELMKTLPLGFASYFAKPRLYYPWIHIDDVAGIMVHAIETESLRGAYNTSGPAPMLMHDLLKQALLAKRSKALLVPAPPIAIKIALGEMSEMVLNSQRCSADKILASGYKFKYPQIAAALENLLG
jgi:uncharacterized protein (TIGR01777 family)